jgi:hypothetical protein
MELLLNLVWISVALLTLASFLQRRRECSWTARVPHHKALLAIGCALVLLFPVVSASDDLHPTQAVFDDANKRIHQLSAVLQHVPGDSSPDIIPALLAVCLISLLLVLEWRETWPEVVRIAGSARIPEDGRSPPRP